MRQELLHTPWPENLATLYRQCGYWSGQSLLEILNKQARSNPKKIAIVDSHHKRSYEDLLAKVESLAYGFWELGLKKSDRVVLHTHNCVEFYEVLFALMRIGVIPVLALPLHREEEIQQFIIQSKAQAYITLRTAEICPYVKIARHLKNNRLVERVIVGVTLSNTKKACNSGDSNRFILLEDLALRVDESFQVPLPQSTQVALLQLSGGTTGTPKLIPRTHDDYFYSVRTSVEVCEINRGTNYLCVLPIAHNFILSSPGALGVLYAGGTVYLAPDPSPGTAFSWIEKYKINMCALVPPLAITWMTAWKNLKLRGEIKDISSLKLLQVGGAKLSPTTAEQVTPVLGCKLQQVFGMAEGLVNYTRLNDELENIVNTQGRPMSPADEILIVDDNDEPLPIGEVGHLLTRGPYTIQGYFQAEDHNRKSFTLDGFYRTGDLARCLPSGHIIVSGRSKDQINKGGEKISAEEVENLLLRDQRVLDVAVIAIPDDYLGERICACVVLSDEYSALTKAPASSAILSKLREINIATYKIPDRIKIMEQLPKTKFGKIDKAQLRKLIAHEVSNFQKRSNADKKAQLS